MNRTREPVRTFLVPQRRQRILVQYQRYPVSGRRILHDFSGNTGCHRKSTVPGTWFQLLLVDFFVLHDTRRKDLKSFLDTFLTQ
jgi:hypothetical protein